jgi:hypothetical protein
MLSLNIRRPLTQDQSVLTQFHGFQDGRYDANQPFRIAGRD